MRGISGWDHIDWDMENDAREQMRDVAFVIIHLKKDRLFIKLLKEYLNNGAQASIIAGIFPVGNHVYYSLNDDICPEFSKRSVSISRSVNSYANAPSYSCQSI